MLLHICGPRDEKRQLCQVFRSDSGASYGGNSSASNRGNSSTGHSSDSGPRHSGDSSDVAKS